MSKKAALADAQRLAMLRRQLGNFFRGVLSTFGAKYFTAATAVMSARE
jgi:hypothetical protein